MCPSSTGLSRGTRPRSTSRRARPWKSGRCAGSIGCPIGLNPLNSHRTCRLHGPATRGRIVAKALGSETFAMSSGCFERCDISHRSSPYGDRLNPRVAGAIVGADTCQPGLSTTITVPAEMRRGRPA